MLNPSHQAIISLGSNLGDSANTIQQALEDIAKSPNIKLTRSSSLYQTTPVGYQLQPDFINAICSINTTHSPHDLLAQLQRIEQKYQRVKTFRNGPRTLDLDIIDFNGLIITSKTLTIPHPRAYERAFVIIPLAEILPNYLLKNGHTASEWKKQLKAEGVQLLFS